jgi:hypothetical protein
MEIAGGRATQTVPLMATPAKSPTKPTTREAAQKRAGDICKPAWSNQSCPLDTTARDPEVRHDRLGATPVM